MTKFDQNSEFNNPRSVLRYDDLRVTNGPEDLANTLRKFAPDSTLGQLSESLKISRIIADAVRKKGLRIDFNSQVFVQATQAGISLNTQTASLANRLKQIQPTLERALFDAGIYAPIVSIRAGKIAIVEEKEESYPTGEPRIAQPGASVAVSQEAQRVKDDELRQALEHLANAIER